MTQHEGRVSSRDAIVAEEDLVIDVQFLIQELMDERRMTRAALAEKLGVSRARLSQLMKPDANPTLRSIARILVALDDALVVDAKSRRQSRPGRMTGGDTVPAMGDEEAGAVRLETGAAADRAYTAFEASFARPWKGMRIHDVSNDRSDGVDSDTGVLLEAA